MKYPLNLSPFNSQYNFEPKNILSPVKETQPNGALSDGIKPPKNLNWTNTEFLNTSSSPSENTVANAPSSPPQNSVVQPQFAYLGDGLENSASFPGRIPSGNFSEDGSNKGNGR
jgi:hypothetical protein